MLTAAKAKSILADDLEPELKNGNPDRAVALAVLEILRNVDSPLIQNGKAEEILKSGGFEGDLQPSHIFVVHTRHGRLAPLRNHSSIRSSSHTDGG